NGSIRNCLVAQNTAILGPNIYHNLLSAGHNLVENGANGTLFSKAATDQVGTAGSPILSLIEPLANNGGYTPTHGIDEFSPAANNGTAQITGGGTFVTDQRGEDRVVG